MLAAAAVTAGSAPLLPKAVRAQEATPTAGTNDVTASSLSHALEKIDELAKQRIADKAVPGIAIAVVHDDAVVFSQGYGVRDVKTNEPVDVDTVFQIASLSKPISSSVVAAIVGAGDATWDDLVADRYPGFLLADPYITHNLSLRDCFCHRSGMPGTVGGDLETIGYDRAAIIERMRYVPITGAFRQTYSYSNMMMTLGAEAAVIPTEQSWEDAAEMRVFAPLGMTSTSYRYQDFLDQENRSALHVVVDGAWDSMIERDAAPQAPAGGLNTSVRDLAQWVRMQLAGGSYAGTPVIDSDALAETHLPQIMRGLSPVNGRPGFYALGWGSDTNADGRIVWRHAGAFTVGSRTDVLLIPEANLGIVVLTNGFPTGTPDALNEIFYELVFHGEPSRDWFAFYDAAFQSLRDSFVGDPDRFKTPPSPPSEALPNAAYVGTYANDYVGEVRVEEGDGGLQVIVGPAAEPWPLTHWDRDTFTYESFPEPPAPTAAARFTIGDDGQAVSLFLESMSEFGFGTVTRASD